ncbi:MAG: MarR family transcriptional regulator [Acidimicrobiales bacterium]|jgi:DNA-binding MarR family transcriptional regulator
MMSIERTALSPSRPGDLATAGLSHRELLVDRYCELQPQMQRRFSALLHRELREELHAITGHQLSVLTYLRGQSVTMRELAKELDVGESAATAVVDRLVRQGLVVRCDDPSDRRVVRLALSDTGESLVTKLHATACKKAAGLLMSLSDDQLAQLVATMEMLDAAAVAHEALTGCEPAKHENAQEELAI